MTIFDTEDPLKRKVCLKRNTWEYKILDYHNTNSNGEHGNSHPEMEKYLPEIEECIKHPHYIIQDTEVDLIDGQETEVVSDNREEYLRIFFDQDDKMQMIKTVVEFEGNQGEVVTTHKLRKLINKGKGRIIYER